MENIAKREDIDEEESFFLFCFLNLHTSHHHKYKLGKLSNIREKLVVLRFTGGTQMFLKYSWRKLLLCEINFLLSLGS